jgi:TonB family protein
MKLAMLVLVLLVSLPLPACFGQNTAPSTPPDNTPAPVRDSHSTRTDEAVPLCPATFNDSLATDSIVAIDDKSATLPVIEDAPEAEISDKVRHMKAAEGTLNFQVTIDLVVDAQGKPQELCLRRSAGYGLDANAAKAVELYKFTPATRNGIAVARRISIKIGFYR